MKFTIDGDLKIDLARLIETRCLIQANSGGGKSYLIRKLLEETHGKVQQIVLDMEGEFATLREKFDYILAGKGGDIPADPKTAELLARKILELETSLIVDLYELKQHERIRFVKNFIDSMVNAPKNLYHPVLVVIDEAHVFVPERGESEAMSAVVDLATRGRKRGFAAVLATQRLSKLHKDVAAECLNKFIGRTSLDIDRKRAAEELGFLSAKDSLALRKLEPGSFYVFGPAVSDDVKLIKVGDVQTSHPKAGQRLGHKTTKPTENVRAALKKLVDLPAEAENELRDKEAMTKRIRELEREVRRKPAPEIDEGALERAAARGRAEAAKQVKHLQQVIKTIQAHLSKAIAASDTIISSDTPATTEVAREPLSPILISKRTVPRAPRAHIEIDGRTFGQCERKILGFLLMKNGEWMTKIQVGAMTGYSHGSGGFNNSISNLTQSGLILRRGGEMTLNADAVHTVEEIVGNDTPHTLQDWLSKLGVCERAIYQILLDAPLETVSKDEVAQKAGYSSGSGGFNNAISRLSTLGLIKRHNGGLLRINDELVNI